MQTNAQSLSAITDLAASMALIDSIDLSMVRRKLMDEEGWSEKAAGIVEQRYRRFLCLHLMDRELVLVPARDIDKFWHQHILHTRDYARDCSRVFGEFLHHLPASGDSDDSESMRKGFEETESLYRKLFGEEYIATNPAVDDAKYEKWVSFFT